MRFKKVTLAFFIALCFPLSIIAEENLDWPELEYDTYLIGKFMGFCNMALTSQATRATGEIKSSDPTDYSRKAVRVCSCIVDNYRKNNSEFLFTMESEVVFEKRNAPFPFFKSYYESCVSISNNRHLKMVKQINKELGKL